MDFGFDEQQKALAASVRDVIDSRFGMAYVRGMLDDPRGFSLEFWAEAAKLGWLGLLVEERYGGLGLGPLEMAAVQQELGRGVVPGPYLASAVLASVALQRYGSERQKKRWLPSLAAGDEIATVVFPEAHRASEEGFVGFTAERPSRTAFRVTGEQRFVLDAHVADLAVVPAIAEEGVTLFLVETCSPGVTTQPIRTIDDTRRLATMRFDGIEVEANQILGEAGAGLVLLEAVADVGRVALSAEMVGGAERALEMCIDYARVREQFGRPIGSFQAIQHKCADMLVRVEGARAMTLAAATSLAHGDADATSDAGIAKSWCGEAYRMVTTEGVQIHGGLGFTWDLDMHLFYKRAKSSETSLGDARFHRARLAERALGES
ncbi:MAG: acyl-CoA dehydrogenase [Deltaproteobacteria bacterium]|nr:acyl-CoA dehydrogenase [Deltaproteobacteria bacterium]